MVVTVLVILGGCVGMVVVPGLGKPNELVPSDCGCYSVLSINLLLSSIFSSPMLQRENPQVQPRAPSTQVRKAM